MTISVCIFEYSERGDIADVWLDSSRATSGLTPEVWIDGTSMANCPRLLDVEIGEQAPL